MGRFCCNDCGAIFDEPAGTSWSETYELHGLKTYECDDYHCPECKSDDFDEATKCVLCGEWQNQDVCDKCLNKELTLENALDVGKTYREEVEINEFLALNFTLEQVEKILLENLKKEPKLNAKIKDYLYQEKDWFRGWVKRRKWNDKN